MNLSLVMTAIADTIRDGGVMERVYDWPSESITVPAALVGYPESMTFDITFGRGADQATFPVWLVVGRASDRNSRDALSALIKDATGIKGVLDGDLGGAVQSARLTELTVETVTIGSVDYLSAKGMVEVVA